MMGLPPGWTIATLSDLLHRIEAGLNVKCEERPPTEGERGLVKISAVTWGRFDEAQSKTLPSDLSPDERNRIRPGDLLISRANTIELVGASVIVERIQRQLYLSDKVLRLQIHEPAKRWINYALKTPSLRKDIEDASSGNQLSMRNISQDKLRGLRLPLAPEPEQRRIADKLDTVLARVDSVNDRLARVAPLLKRFRQSVLKSAMSGSLDDHGPSRKRVRLGDLVQCRSGSGFPPALQGRSSGEVFFAKVSDVSAAVLNHRGVLAGAANWVAHNDLINLGIKLIPAGSTVFAKIGEGLKLNRRALTAHECAIDNNCMALIPDVGRLAARYLYYFMQTVDLGQFAIATAVPSVRRGDIESIQINLPSLALQAEVISKIDLLLAYADRLEARLQAAQTATERLTPALLAKAFRGELVPQDPNDEPASELLKRLAAQRAQAGATSARPRGRKPSALAK